MQSETLYAGLIEGASPAGVFDAHVVACVVTLAVIEAETTGCSVSEGTGLSRDEMEGLLAAVNPCAVSLVDGLAAFSETSFSTDELCLRELLGRYSTARNHMQFLLAAVIARRAMRPNHLWQDLGLRNRGELSQLMQRHFAPLAARNAQDMKWKKFLYRMICRDEGFTLCVAPSCSECKDFEVCFSDESGESLLARNRRGLELFEPRLAPLGLDHNRGAVKAELVAQAVHDETLG